MSGIHLAICHLRSILGYNADTGVLTWKRRPVEMFNQTPSRTAEHACRQWNSRFAGREAGSLHKSGAITVRIFGKNVYAHRVIWAMKYGEWPIEVDHKRGNRGNNAESNLRSVTHAENMLNKRLYKNNVSGAHGVSWASSKGKWQAYITFSGKRKHIGYYESSDAAIAARRDAEAGLFFENHGVAA